MQTNDESQESPQEKLRRLQNKKIELESLLRAIEATLIDDGYLTESSFADSQKTPPLTGIRINNELSFRGQEKAGDFFDYLDEDGDGYLTLLNIRGISMTT